MNTTTESWHKHHVLVIGLGKTGLSVAQLLHQLGAQVIVNEGQLLPEDHPDVVMLSQLGIPVVSGAHPESLLDGVTYCVKSPGIPYHVSIIEQALQKGIPVYTDIEIASKVSEAPIIAITGSNGKTTTTTLVAEMLNHHFMRHNESKTAYIAGNIGIPASEVVQQATCEDVIILEVSSFQLLGTRTFHPHIAAILNIYDAHLDYHGTKKEYIEAKWRIQQAMDDNDLLILNQAQQSIFNRNAYTTKARIETFSLDHKADAYLHQNRVMIQNHELLDADQVMLPGDHNLENSLVAALIAAHMGCDDESIIQVLTTFSGVKHRMQYVGMINERKFYNDSKATNELATLAALSGFDLSQVILIAGGLDRGSTFEALKPELKKLKGVVSLGETKDKFYTLAKQMQIPYYVQVKTMNEAVIKAYDFSQEHDIILLSPACASWDMYQSFEQRGEAFISAVNDLKKEKEKE